MSMRREGAAAGCCARRRGGLARDARDSPGSAAAGSSTGSGLSPASLMVADSRLFRRRDEQRRRWTRISPFPSFDSQGKENAPHEALRRREGGVVARYTFFFLEEPFLPNCTRIPGRAVWAARQRGRVTRCPATMPGAPPPLSRDDFEALASRHRFLRAPPGPGSGPDAGNEPPPLPSTTAGLDAADRAALRYESRLFRQDGECETMRARERGGSSPPPPSIDLPFIHHPSVDSTPPPPSPHSDWALCDLSQSHKGRLGLRWRTSAEVAGNVGGRSPGGSGGGRVSRCGALRGPEGSRGPCRATDEQDADGRRSSSSLLAYEIPFAYRDWADLPEGYRRGVGGDDGGAAAAAAGAAAAAAAAGDPNTVGTSSAAPVRTVLCRVLLCRRCAALLLASRPGGGHAGEGAEARRWDGRDGRDGRRDRPGRRRRRSPGDDEADRKRDGDRRRRSRSR